MLAVTTDPDLKVAVNGFALHANYMGIKCLGLPRTALEADFLVSGLNGKTHRAPGVILRRKKILGVVLGTTYVLRKPDWKKRHSSGDLLSEYSRASMTSRNWGVAVTVAVHCSTPATFQAFTSDPLCAQNFCKLFVRCDLPIYVLLTMDDS